MIGLTTQVSLYPLCQAALLPAIEKAFKISQEHGLEVRPGSMGTVFSGESSVVFQVLQHTFAVRNARRNGYGGEFVN